MAASIALIHKEHLGTQDNLRTTAYFTINGSRWRVALRRNTYDHQSEFHADRWDGGQWQRVHSALDHERVPLMRYKPSSHSRNITDWHYAAESTARRLAELGARLTGDLRD